MHNNNFPFSFLTGLPNETFIDIKFDAVKALNPTSFVTWDVTSITLRYT